MRVRWSRAETRLIDLVRRRLAAQRSALDLRLERLRLLSPLASLERGWALVRTDAGTLVRDAAEVQVGQALTVLVKGGSLEVVVTKATPVRDTPDDREGDRHRA
jgi:exodeoxyribonuclease VII large subunit